MVAGFAGKTALVVGAGGGLGREVSLALSEEGAAVVLAGRTQDKLLSVKAEVAERGGLAETAVVDITSQSSVDAFFGKLSADRRQLDVAINCAGIFEVSAVKDIDEAAWNRMIETNLTGTWRCLKGEIEMMLKTGGGSIVNVSSIVGNCTAIPGTGAYGMTKSAIEALSRTAAKEYISHGIRINTVSPGAFDTPMSLMEGETEEQRAERLGSIIPIGRIGRTSEIARSILWVCSEDASFFVGHDFVLDGGFTA